MSAGIHPGRATAEDSAVVGNSLGPQGGGAGASVSPGSHGGGGLGSQGGGTGGSGSHGPHGGPQGGSGGQEPADLTSIATDLAGTAAEKGRALLEGARDQATGFADQRKDGAAQSIADIAASLRETGGSFEGQPNIKAFVGSAADGLDQLATSLRDRSFADIYGDVEAYARRQPVAVGAAAALAGFLLARFIKSSADELSDMNSGRTAGGARSGAARTGQPVGAQGRTGQAGGAQGRSASPSGRA